MVVAARDVVKPTAAMTAASIVHNTVYGALKTIASTSRERRQRALPSRKQLVSTGDAHYPRLVLAGGLP